MKISFKRNLGNVDRIIRGALGIALIGFGILNFLFGLGFVPTWSFLIIGFGIFMLIEGIIGY